VLACYTRNERLGDAVQQWVYRQRTPGHPVEYEYRSRRVRAGEQNPYRSGRVLPIGQPGGARNLADREPRLGEIGPVSALSPAGR
jgi:hypothetical protein